MKFICTGLFVTLAFTFSTFGQNDQTPAARVVITNNLPAPQPPRTPAAVPRPVQTPIVVGTTKPQPAPSVGPVSRSSNLNHKGMSFAQIKQQLSEAKRHLMATPLTIGSSEPRVFTTIIRVAFLDPASRQIDSYSLSKEQFLASGTATPVITAKGKQMYSRTIRGNGVNTPLVVTDMNGREYVPLVVQYPREKRGILTEMAYYVSSHPQIMTTEVVNAGRFYVRNTIDIAREKLRLDGYPIQPRVADNAERLATVEHVDHLRFRTEPHPNIYNDIFALYAFNEGQTYRYSVSSAGAGGMVQMIPSTYRMVRSRFPRAALMPDFVEGMRNHVNASKAMLLYMQMTWNDLSASPTVVEALRTGIATQEQLMAAGYNSNPAKLPGYIKRAGASWKFVIPRETQIYLQIWDSLENAVPMASRTR